ncbi:hypothetical protein GCM10011519_09750 [Marmoricola endophyticus]|uniref:site-specific DNA-methyltransferase (adenine-specific) n=1 Tax=Marmoricola endophyticus TaxID=2040280 RepID=A0A917BDW8_9ACTN|nr:hypothetical protein GCM10011519_09750 [Marmoricola endophyticus]
MVADPTAAAVLAVRDALAALAPGAPSAAALAGETIRVLLRARAGGAVSPERVRTAVAAVPADTDLGSAYELLLGAQRAGRGTFYTPPWLVDLLLDQALDPVLDEAGDDPAALLALRVCDPTCGSGRFLAAAVRRLASRLRRAGHQDPVTAAAGCVHGVDIDPVAVEIARAALPTGVRLRVADALRPLPGLDGACDVVVGNPPFRSRLRRGGYAEVPPEVDGVALGPYTDLSAAVLLRGAALLAPGGRLALVQPRALLSARDAGPVRRAVNDRAALVGLWAGTRPVFPGTPVLTCAPVLRRGAVGGGTVRVIEDGGPAREVAAPQDGWGRLLAEHPYPVPGLAHRRRLGEEARVTADFRDQYYGLVGCVVEGGEHSAGPDSPALLTSGTIDPAYAAWGERPTRFARRDWQHPVVPLSGLEPAMARWAAARTVPKLLLATQGRVLEAVADETGTWLPGVPVLSVVAPPHRLWHLLAALLSPVLTAHAAAEYAGSALAASAVKLSATQVADLPLPDPGRAWDAAADAARRAQEDAGNRAAHLLAAATLTTQAYGADPALVGWWVVRAERSVPGIGREWERSLSSRG